MAAVDGKPVVHLCHGLNDCKNQGASKKNDCAGKGDCATAKHHDCGAQNECKGLGGCGENPAANDCKEKGGCRVPLMDDAWKTVRARLEAKAKSEKKTLGKDPGPKKS